MMPIFSTPPHHFWESDDYQPGYHSMYMLKLHSASTLTAGTESAASAAGASFGTCETTRTTTTKNSTEFLLQS